MCRSGPVFWADSGATGSGGRNNWLQNRHIGTIDCRRDLRLRPSSWQPPQVVATAGGRGMPWVLACLCPAIPAG